MADMSTEERLLRDAIDRIVHDVRGVLAEYPADVAVAGGGAAGEARQCLDRMHGYLTDLAGAAGALERVADASTEALLLCGATRVAVQLLSDTLAYLSAELDSLDAAA
jgi:hypothetical protein